MLTGVLGALVKELHMVKNVLELVYFTFSKYKEDYFQCKTCFFLVSLTNILGALVNMIFFLLIRDTIDNFPTFPDKHR
jgi:hypothetical protein